MSTVTIARRYCTFDDLSESAKERAREWYREQGHCWDCNDSDDLRECIQFWAEDAGYYVKKNGVRFEVGYGCEYVQVDGRVDFDALCRKHPDLAELAAEIERCIELAQLWGMLVMIDDHSDVMNLELEELTIDVENGIASTEYRLNSTPDLHDYLDPYRGYDAHTGEPLKPPTPFQRAIEEIEEKINDIHGDNEGQWLKWAQEDYESYYSDEFIDETLTANEWWFDEDGDFVSYDTPSEED